MTQARRSKNQVSATLKERGKRYGSFEELARIAQSLKDAMKDSPNWDSLTPAMKESLEAQASKIGRILKEKA